MSNTVVVVLNQTTKKQKLLWKSTMRRFKLSRVTLGEMQTASPPWQIHQVSSWSCFCSCSSLHIRWNGYKGVQQQLQISVSLSMDSYCFSAEPLVQLMKWMYFVCLLILTLRVLDFPPLPALLEHAAGAHRQTPRLLGAALFNKPNISTEYREEQRKLCKGGQRRKKRPFHPSILVLSFIFCLVPYKNFSFCDTE